MTALATRADDLRQAFDGQFAVARASDRTRCDDLLAIRLGGDRYALRLEEIAGLFVDRPVTPLPGPVAELLGIAGFRGAPIPVYDLSLLLGYSGGGGAPRWLVLVPVRAAAPAVVGLAFEHFDGHLQVPRAALMADGQADAGRRHIRGIAPAEDGARPIIDLPSLLTAITQRTSVRAPPRNAIP